MRRSWVRCLRDQLNSCAGIDLLRCLTWTARLLRARGLQVLGARREVLAMAFVALALLLAGTGILYAASEFTGHGYLWADQICNTVPNLCEHPYWSVLATIATGSLYILAHAIEN